ncbi:MAG: 2-isopropylmalate synthase [Candidatus Lokiarchaeum sp. GC14_75]|nr:MAG: 2-isopropylmalate synthase [Candidatus Lokiarchaeum sp. GC14_75]
MREETKWFNRNWWVSPLNYNKEVKEPLKLPERVYVRDSTIREGEETPGVYFTLEQKIKIVEKLEKLGVEHIDCGYIGQVQDQWDLANELKELGFKIKTYSHLSSNPSRWTAEIKKSLDARIDYIGFGIVLTEWQLQLFTHDENVTPDVMISMIPTVLKRIKRMGGNTILDCVDATRTDLPTLINAIDKGMKYGAAMVMLYDTVGACNVSAISYLIKQLIPIVKNIPLGIHVHDDFGLGTASTIAAIEQGVVFMDLVVNKLGDRAGNTSFEEVIVGLEMLYSIDTGIDLSNLYNLSKYIEKVSGVPLPYNKPIVGRNTFLHESELHVMSALEKDKFWMCFTHYRPEIVGQKERVIFGPTTLHGDAIRMKCEQLGLKNCDNYLEEILENIQSRITEKKFISEGELETIIKKVVK